MILSARRVGGLALAILPAPACAHSPVPGIEGFYTGLVHPLSTPAQALVVMGLGLLLGWLDPKRARVAFAVYGAALIAGLLFGGGPKPYDPVLFATAFAACALAALLSGRLLPLICVVAAAAGWGLGVVSVPDPGPTRDWIITQAGAFLGAALGPFYLFGLSYYLRQRFPAKGVAVALRVAAAWLAAISLVMFALLVAAARLPA